jgi:hypothetical protein
VELLPARSLPRHPRPGRLQAERRRAGGDQRGPCAAISPNAAASTSTRRACARWCRSTSAPTSTT